MSTAPIAPAATRRMSKGQRREQLLLSARGVFVERGYHGSGMDDIASAAGVSKPVLYQHFQSKLELYLALLDEANDQLVSSVEAALAQPDPAGRVHRTVHAYFEFFTRPDHPYRLTFDSDIAGEPEVAHRISQVAKRVVAAVTRALDADGGDPVRSELIAVSVVGMAQRAARHWAGRELPMDVDTAVSVVSHLALCGLAGSFGPDVVGVAPPHEIGSLPTVVARVGAVDGNRDRPCNPQGG